MKTDLISKKLTLILAIGFSALSVSRAAEPNRTPFFPFCIDWHDAKKRSYQDQAPMLKELGYDGVGHIWLDGVAERLKTLDEAGLKLYQITMVVDLSPGKQPYDVHFKDVLGLIKGRGVQFDLLMNGLKPSDASADPHARPPTASGIPGRDRIIRARSSWADHAA